MLGEDRAAVAAFDEQWNTAGVIDMRMAEDHGIDVGDIHGKGSGVALFVVVPAL